ncbi:MAG: hypothetical protein E2600_08275 [Chryseobacterium sp.]|nr:hypothetical protein [Chryseobacterium sp.]
MKHLYTIFLALNFIISYGQEYSFAKEFTTGSINLKDLLTVDGELKWFPSQTNDLKFRKNEKEKAVKYKPSDILGFSSENMRFVTLTNFTAFADTYALVGRPIEIKETFGEVISEGKFNIFLVIITGYNPISGGIGNYSNFLFQDSQDKNGRLYAYPYLIRMKEKKYENAKEQLYILFKDYPEIIEKIKNFKKEDNFLEIIETIKSIK